VSILAWGLQAERRATGFGEPATRRRRRVPRGARNRPRARGADTMDNSLLIGLSRQVALGRELEVVANNIANIGTTGFKSDNSIFEQFLMPEAVSGGFPAGSRQVDYVRDRQTWHNFAPGPIQRTGGPLDVAIDGNAFLVVQTAGGQRYTRNGALQISPTRALVTNAGDPLVGTSRPT